MSALQVNTFAGVRYQSGATMNEKTTIPDSSENHAVNPDDMHDTEQGEQRREPSLSRTNSSRGDRILSEEEVRKVRLVEDACHAHDRASLVQLAVSEHGIVVDRLRKLAWPILLGYDTSESIESATEDPRQDWQTLLKHNDEDQVKLDVNRSFIYYPRDRSPKEIERRKTELSNLIVEVLRRYPFLCYFQGYHDICQVFLLVLGRESLIPAVSHLSLLRIRDFMLPSLSPALSHLRLLPPLLSAVDPELCSHLSQTQPFFALAATLTLYAHDIQEFGDIARLFDALLAREAVFSVYLFAVIVLQRKDELFDIPPDEPEMLHSVLCKLPKPLNLESLISKTVVLFDLHPPESLYAWRWISPNSVLKTSRYPQHFTNQTLEDGVRYYKKQVAELERAEQRRNIMSIIRKYRRPAGTIGLAVMVGVLAWWMRRNGGGNQFIWNRGAFGALVGRFWQY